MIHAGLSYPSLDPKWNGSVREGGRRTAAMGLGEPGFASGAGGGRTGDSVTGKHSYPVGQAVLVCRPSAEYAGCRATGGDDDPNLSLHGQV